MNLRKLNISVLLLLASLCSFTRAYSQDTLQKHKLSVHYNIGTSFAMTNGYGSGLSTWVSPNVSYPLGKRFTVSAGLTVMNTTLYGYKPYYYSVLEQPLSSYSGNITSALIYVSGSYRVNDRLTISGSAYKQFPLYNANPSKYPYLNPDSQGLYMNVGYKIRDNIYFEAGFGYRKGGIYNDYSPFGTDPAFSGYSPVFH